MTWIHPISSSHIRFSQSLVLPFIVSIDQSLSLFFPSCWSIPYIHSVLSYLPQTQIKIRKMQLKTTIFTALIAAAPALAFTNGSLVPPYICHPTNDGLPKSFGQLLQFTREQTPKVAFSANGS
jgi:hypothetical protein